MSFTKTTEQSSKYEHLEKMSVTELLTNINQEDQTVAVDVQKALPQKLSPGGLFFFSFVF